MRFGPFLAVAVLAFTCVAAKADTANPVGGSGGGFSGTGTLYAISNGNGSYTITGISGTGVDGLIAPGGFNGNDNQLFPSSTPALDANGFGFTDTQGDTDFQVDMFYSTAAAGYEAYILDSDGWSSTIPVTFALSGSPTEDALFAHALVASAAPATVDFNFSYAVSDVKAPAPTPEPSGLALLGTGFLGLAGLVRKRRKSC